MTDAITALPSVAIFYFETTGLDATTLRSLRDASCLGVGESDAKLDLTAYEHWPLVETMVKVAVLNRAERKGELEIIDRFLAQCHAFLLHLASMEFDPLLFLVDVFHDQRHARHLRRSIENVRSTIATNNEFSLNNVLLLDFHVVDETTGDGAGDRLLAQLRDSLCPLHPFVHWDAKDGHAIDIPIQDAAAAVQQISRGRTDAKHEVLVRYAATLLTQHLAYSIYENKLILDVSGTSAMSAVREAVRKCQAVHEFTAVCDSYGWRNSRNVFINPYESPNNKFLFFNEQLYTPADLNLVIERFAVPPEALFFLNTASQSAVAGLKLVANSDNSRHTSVQYLTERFSRMLNPQTWPPEMLGPLVDMVWKPQVDYNAVKNAYEHPPAVGVVVEALPDECNAFAFVIKLLLETKDAVAWPPMVVQPQDDIHSYATPTQVDSIDNEEIDPCVRFVLVLLRLAVAHDDFVPLVTQSGLLAIVCECMDNSDSDENALFHGDSLDGVPARLIFERCVNYFVPGVVDAQSPRTLDIIRKHRAVYRRSPFESPAPPRMSREASFVDEVDAGVRFRVDETHTVGADSSALHQQIAELMAQNRLLRKRNNKLVRKHQLALQHNQGLVDTHKAAWEDVSLLQLNRAAGRHTNRPLDTNFSIPEQIVSISDALFRNLNSLTGSMTNPFAVYSLLASGDLCPTCNIVVCGQDGLVTNLRKAEHKQGPPAYAVHVVNVTDAKSSESFQVAVRFVPFTKPETHSSKTPWCDGPCFVLLGERYRALSFPARYANPTVYLNPETPPHAGVDQNVCKLLASVSASDLAQTLAQQVFESEYRGFLITEAARISAGSEYSVARGQFATNSVAGLAGAAKMFATQIWSTCLEKVRRALPPVPLVRP